MCLIAHLKLCRRNRSVQSGFCQNNTSNQPFGDSINSPAGSTVQFSFSFSTLDGFAIPHGHSQLLLITPKLLWQTHASATLSTRLFVYVMILIVIMRETLHQLTMALCHYLDYLDYPLPGSARSDSETISQSTDVCHSRQMLNHRKIVLCITWTFFAILPAPTSRRPNPHDCTWLCQRSLFQEHATLCLTAINSTFHVQSSAGQSGSPL